MSCPECIEFTFAPFRKSGNPIVLAVRMENILSASEDFVAVRLVANVPNQQILWRIENVVKCDGKFDDAETRAKMSFFFGNDIDDEIAQFHGQMRQLLPREFSQVIRENDIWQKWCAHGCGKVTI